MATILGLDLGTNSIGWAVRDTNKADTLQEQITSFGVTRFDEGVGKDKTGEYSFAAQRTSFRSARRLYQSRKYRIWATLEVLIKHNLCPLSMEDLDRWRKYDKEKGLKREYPADAEAFEQWVRLDFDNDGKPDFVNPFEIRHLLATQQYTFQNEKERYMLGRMLYNIAQRRGFRSSKGETIASQEDADLADMSAISMKQSEIKKSKELNDYMEKKQQEGIEFHTIGSALYSLTQEGYRVRKDYPTVRSSYLEEINYVFDFQNALSVDSDLYKEATKAIFYQRPLRSQKGNVGKCTLEPKKNRCSQTHPDFEYFRTWSLLNNIKYKTNKDDSKEEFEPIPLKLKEQLYQKTIKASNLKFADFKEDMIKFLGLNEEKAAFNYNDATSISASKITYYLQKLLGEDWRHQTIASKKTKVNKTTGEEYTITYNWEDLWHICFSFDDPECVLEFANSLNLDEKQVQTLCTMWKNTSQGYAMLSLKAIRNINRFLALGLIYSHAVLLAKIPDIMGENKWNEYKDQIIMDFLEQQEDIAYQKMINKITNSLIAQYFVSEEHSAKHNWDYTLTDYDHKDIRKACEKCFGNKTWAEKTEQDREEIIAFVTKKYQEFFSTNPRDYCKTPKQGEKLQRYLLDTFAFLNEKDVELLYHPSEVSCYSHAETEKYIVDDKVFVGCLLGSPRTNSFRNPMAMRMLFALKKLVNDLLKAGKIDNDTKIVIETARQLNDANLRWAIKHYNDEKEKENAEIIKILQEYKQPIDSELLREKVKIAIDNTSMELKTSNKEADNRFGAELEKFILLKDQKFTCMYTGKTISIEGLLGDNPQFDIEHTLPQSKVLNNSLANKTICDSYYNRNIKKNILPVDLPNYDRDYTHTNGTTYTAIKPRLKKWEERVEALQKRKAFWSEKSKKAMDKDSKDKAIRQRHMWQMELDYWQEKLNGFTMREINQGFAKKQLVDTHIISKYAVLFLKTAFDHVEVQKGSVTAEFRKILEFQPKEEPKDRSLHFHHAVDATVLTLVPYAQKRENILALYNEREEKKKLFIDYSSVDSQLKAEIKSLRLGDNPFSVVDKIKEQILVNSISRNNAFNLAKKLIKTRGKAVLNKNGEKMYQQGDSIRGELHAQTFYAAIKQPNGTLKYAVREPISNYEQWSKLLDNAVDKNIVNRAMNYYGGKTLKDALAESGGVLHYLDKQGKQQSIRHIRIYQAVSNPAAIKAQTYLSAKEHKQKYYVKSLGLYAISKYSNPKKSIAKVWTYLDILENRKNNLGDIPTKYRDEKGKEYTLDFTLTRGTKVLVLAEGESKDDIKDILSKRLYVYEKPDSRTDIKVYLTHHNAAVYERGKSISDFNNMPQQIRQSLTTLNLLVEGKDFTMDMTGEIKFI